MKYRKKPVVIEVYQYKQGFLEDNKIPFEFRTAVCLKPCMDKQFPHIHTLEGNHFIKVYDWIVKGVKGEFYPIKNDIFLETYEKVD